MGPLYLPESKKNAKSEGAVIVFEDEASFRQTPTLHATWAKRGSQPQILTRGAPYTKNLRSCASRQRRFHLPSSGGLFSVGDLSGLPGASGRARLLPPPDLPDSRQCVISQKTVNL